MSRRPVIGGNWKCNPASKSALDGLIANFNACDTTDCDLFVCPSPLHVDYCCGKFTNATMITPQNCNFKGCGAFTGEMSVEQMKDMGITNVAHLAGGMPAWREAGGPTEKKTKK